MTKVGDYLSCCMQLKMSKLRGIGEIGDWVLVRIVISNLKLMVYGMEWSLENKRESNYLLEIHSHL